MECIATPTKKIKRKENNQAIFSSPYTCALTYSNDNLFQGRSQHWLMGGADAPSNFKNKNFDLLI